MPESIANLRRENNDLKSKVSTLTEEISRLKDLVQQQSSSAAPSAKEKSHSLEFLSNEYDDFLLFKTTANKELQRLSSQLSEVKARVDAIANAIDEFQEYSFQYRIELHLPNNKKSVCDVTYRQHNNANEFLEYLTDFLERQCRQSQNIYLMGDFNIDLLKYETCSYTQTLLQTMQSFSMFPVVDKPDISHFARVSFL